MKGPHPVLLVLYLLAGAAASAVPPEDAGQADMVGDETCLGCHEGLEAYRETVHARVLTGGDACEQCHGPGGRHVEEMDPAFILTFDPSRKDEDPGDWDARCLACHEKEARVHWRGSVHQTRSVGCVSCHEVMRKVSDHSLLKRAGGPSETCYACHFLERADTWRSSHMPVREGKMECLSCHQPHGSAGPSLLNAYSVNENCYRCHAEKRGPFLWEHPPAREDCSNCHAVHGSIYANMLLRDTPRLCMQCHIASRHPTVPNEPDSRFVFNKACVNCHPSVHGSNHPSGYRLMR